MGLETKHPEYDSVIKDQALCRDCYEGERAVKDKGEEYLPKTSGMRVDGTEGEADYKAYKQRAVFPSYFVDAVATMLGRMWSETAVIEVPKKVEEIMTSEGQSLLQLLMEINTCQLIEGRLGLLLDLPSEVDRTTIPYISLYSSATILNWNNDFVALDEASYQLNPSSLEWDLDQSYRYVGKDLSTSSENEGHFGFFTSPAEIDFKTIEFPELLGKKLESLPFQIINSQNTLNSPSCPPLLELANLCQTIYRGEADYRQSLFLQGQDTLVVIGGRDKTNGKEEPIRTGTGAVINVRATGDAKYIGVDSTGLSEQRIALENDRKAASQLAQQLIDSFSAQKESGEALEQRVNSQTITLHQIALAGAAGLQSILETARDWLGETGDVIVTPNLDFSSVGLSGKELLDFMSAKNAGAPLSEKSIHKVLRDRGLTEFSYEDEMSEISSEAPKII